MHDLFWNRIWLAKIPPSPLALPADRCRVVSAACAWFPSLRDCWPIAPSIWEWLINTWNRIWLPKIPFSSPLPLSGFTGRQVAWCSQHVSEQPAAKQRAPNWANLHRNAHVLNRSSNPRKNTFKFLLFTNNTLNLPTYNRFGPEQWSKRGVGEIIVR